MFGGACLSVYTGSEEERAALHRANQFFSLTPIYDSGDGVSIYTPNSSPSTAAFSVVTVLTLFI